jgi:hypothetical protein
MRKLAEGKQYDKPGTNSFGASSISSDENLKTSQFNSPVSDVESSTNQTFTNLVKLLSAVLVNQQEVNTAFLHLLHTTVKVMKTPTSVLYPMTARTIVTTKAYDTADKIICQPWSRGVKRQDTAHLPAFDTILPRPASTINQTWVRGVRQVDNSPAFAFKSILPRINKPTTDVAGQPAGDSNDREISKTQDIDEHVGSGFKGDVIYVGQKLDLPLDIIDPSGVWPISRSVVCKANSVFSKSWARGVIKSSDSTVAQGSLNQHKLCVYGVGQISYDMSYDTKLIWWPPPTKELVAYQRRVTSEVLMCL